MKKTTLTVCSITGLILFGTIGAHAQESDADTELPGQIPMPSIQLSANNSSATASTSIVLVQDAITDVEYDATAVKKPGITQG